MSTAKTNENHNPPLADAIGSEAMPGPREPQNALCPVCSYELDDVHETENGGYIAAHYFECERCGYKESLDDEGEA
jgi:C4-type Zn-finger protein